MLKSAHTSTHAYSYKHTSTKAMCFIFRRITPSLQSTFTYFSNVTIGKTKILKWSIDYYTRLSGGSNKQCPVGASIWKCSEVYDGLGGNPRAGLRNTRGIKASPQVLRGPLGRAGGNGLAWLNLALRLPGYCNPDLDKWKWMDGSMEIEFCK